MSDAPFAPEPPRRSGWVTAVGVVNILVGAFYTLFGLGVAFALGPILNTNREQILNELKKQGINANDAEGVLDMLKMVGPILGIVIVVFGVLFLLAGFGVLGRKGWGRILTLVLAALAGIGAALNLVGFNVCGVLLLGGYCALCYIVLLNKDKALEFRR